MSEPRDAMQRLIKRGMSPMMQRVVIDAAKMRDKAEASTHMSIDAICNCGSCQDAYRAALRQYLQLRESGHCSYWMTQISVAMRYFAMMDMMHYFDVKAEELNVGVSRSDPNGGLTPERSDELATMVTLLNDEQDDLAQIMTQYCGQPEGKSGYEFGGAILKEIFEALDKIAARKGQK